MKPLPPFVVAEICFMDGIPGFHDGVLVGPEDGGVIEIEYYKVLELIAWLTAASDRMLAQRHTHTLAIIQVHTRHDMGELR